MKGKNIFLTVRIVEVQSKDACQEFSVRFQIEIRDEGTGIAHEDLDKLFVDFGKLDANEGMNHQGTGLGLSICKRIIEQMGGTVEVKSELGVGTAFLVTIFTTMMADQELFNKLYKKQQVL